MNILLIVQSSNIDLLVYVHGVFDISRVSLQLHEAIERLADERYSQFKSVRCRHFAQGDLEQELGKSYSQDVEQVSHEPVGMRACGRNERASVRQSPLSGCRTGSERSTWVQAN